MAEQRYQAVLAGAAYVFVRTGRAWSQQAELTEPGRNALGKSVAISNKTALVGAYLTDATGAAFVYVRSGGPGHDSRR